MKQLIFTLLLLINFTSMSFSQAVSKDISSTIIALEKGALERWSQGDPGGYLELSADEVTYFDPSLEQRLDGLDNLKKYYKPIVGKVSISRFEVVNPKVVATDSMAVLTFNLRSYKGDMVFNWSCTEVYRLESSGQWRIVHTHWSTLMKP